MNEAQRFPDHLPEGWKSLLAQEVGEAYFQKLSQFLRSEYSQRTKIFPPREKILRALQEVDYSDVRVVILGQDPYHGEGQAVGLCFAVPNELRIKPPSLKNIFKEIQADLGHKVPSTQSDLSGWVEQGVFLLNTALSVREGQAFSHRDKGWEVFTDKIISHLNARERPIVFLLWGAAAQKKKALITNKIHLVLEAAHPSPLSAHNGFFGCRHFSKANAALKKWGQPEIDWTRISAASQTQAQNVV